MHLERNCAFRLSGAGRGRAAAQAGAEIAQAGRGAAGCGRMMLRQQCGQASGRGGQSLRAGSRGCD